MSTRPLLTPYKIVSAGNMSADVISPATIIQTLSMISYTLVWNGTPNGTFTVEVSNDFSLNTDGSVRNPGNWVPIILSSLVAEPPTAIGVPGIGAIDVPVTGFYAIRLHYVATSGAGFLDATVAGKVA